MTEPTAADRERAAAALSPHGFQGPYDRRRAEDDVAAALAAAREEGRNEIRAKVEKVVAEMSGASVYAPRIRAAMGTPNTLPPPFIGPDGRRWEFYRHDSDGINVRAVVAPTQPEDQP